MASPVPPKTSTPTTKVGEASKPKQPSGTGKSQQARHSTSTPSGGNKPTPVRPISGQSAAGKNTASQSGATGKSTGAGQSVAGKPSPVHSPQSSKLSLGQSSSPRKSIFGKSVGQSGVLKLGSPQSPSKSFFGKSSSGKSPGSGLGQHELPLALRKKRRPNAGMKREAPVSEDKILATGKSPKDGKTAVKRKLSQTSPNGSNNNKIGVKHKADYVPPSSKKRKIIRSNRDQDSRNDFYCWICHKEGSVICCELCPRVYHPRCAKVEGDPVGDWFCPECERATNAECVDSQSQAMSSLTLDQLAKLLMYALKRMKHSGAEPFLKPVSLQHNPGYDEFVFNPMDLSTLEKNIKKRMYGSTEAFLLDAKWIVHNCIVFNGSHHKLTNSARMIIKICEYEMKEIEICPDCYLSASIKRERWFCEVCRDPHKLVWARLQGFPFWPSKVIREKDGLLDVRFFGQHDRAWVPVSSCYMYSHEIPIPSKKKTSGLSTSIMEMEAHIVNLQKAFGKDCFRYAPKRTPYGTFESMVINPKEREKWSVGRVESTSIMNGMSDRSSPQPDSVVADVKIKTEPIDSQPADGTPKTEKTSDSSLNTTKKDALIDKHPPEREKVAEVQAESPAAAKDEESSSDSLSKDLKADPDTLSAKDGTSNTVRRQVFTVTRKPTGGVTQPPDKAVTRISDSMTGSSNRSDSGALESDDSEMSSPSKAPVGVFEVSDESLDIDPEVEAQSPAVQLLGKTHISKNNFGTKSLAIKLSKVSPRSLGKMGQLSHQDEEEEEGGEESDSNMDQEEDTLKFEERDIPARKPTNDTKHEKQRSGESSTALKDKEVTDKSDKLKTQEGDESNQNNSKASSRSNLDAVEPSKRPDPEKDVPCSSQSMPTKDKFHIKLGKTIETMKASLGIERLHSVEKETSDSESSGADSDSDSSEADHSEDSEMEVDEEQVAGVDEKGDSSPARDDAGKSTVNNDATKSHQNDSLDDKSQANISKLESEDNQFPTEPDAHNTKETEKSSAPKEPENPQEASSSKMSKSDSDIDLFMTCHTEVSDSDEGELVIDESRTSGKPNTSDAKKTPTLDSNTTETKDTSGGEFGQSPDVRKMEIHTDLAPMETDDVILVSDPFEPQVVDQSEPKKMQQTEETTPAATVEEKETDLKAVANSSPPPTNPSGDETTSSKDNSQNNEGEESPTSGPSEEVLPSVDPPKSPVAAQSSFPKIVETLQASKRPAFVPDPPKTGEGESVESANATTAVKESASTSSAQSPTGESSTPTQDKQSSKKVIYKKYFEKMSSTLEEVLDEFSVDMTAGKLLQEAREKIGKLTQQIQELMWERKQEQMDFKQIMDLAVAEMKECMEAEAKVALVNLRSQLEAEKQEEIRRTKTKQWCANCGKDAVFFCCWNTSYCDYPCQQSHWSQHRTSCQQRSLGNTVVQVQQIPNKPQQPVPMQLHPSGQSGIQQHLNPTVKQTLQQTQQTVHQPLHQTLQQQVQQVMQQPQQQQAQQQQQPQQLRPLSVSAQQPMQTLIQYVQAPRMSAPVPVRQLVNHHVPFNPSSGRMVGSGGIRVVRP